MKRTLPIVIVAIVALAPPLAAQQNLKFYFSDSGHPERDCPTEPAFAGKILTLGTFMKAEVDSPPAQGYQVAFRIDSCAEIKAVELPSDLHSKLSPAPANPATWSPDFWFAEIAPQEDGGECPTAARASAVFDFSGQDASIPNATLRDGVETLTFVLRLGPELPDNENVRLSFTNDWDWGLGGDTFKNITVHDGLDWLANPMRTCTLTIQGPIVDADAPDACLDICQENVTVRWSIQNFAEARPYLDPQFGVKLCNRFYDHTGSLVAEDCRRQSVTNAGPDYVWDYELSPCSEVTVLVFWVEHLILCEPGGDPDTCSRLIRTDVCTLERRPHLLAEVTPDNLPYWHPIDQLAISAKHGFLEHCAGIEDCGYCAFPELWCLGRPLYHSSLWKIRVRCRNYSFIYHGLRNGNDIYHADTQFLSIFNVQIADLPPLPGINPDTLVYAMLPDGDGPRVVRVSLVLMEHNGQGDPESASSYRIACETASLPLVLGFRRADSNQNGIVNIADVIMGLNMLFCDGFRCTDPVCEVDSNNDNDLSISDAIYILNYMFRSGPKPPVPFDDQPQLAAFGIDAGSKPSNRIPISCGCRCPCTNIDTAPGCDCKDVPPDRKPILYSSDTPAQPSQCP